MNTTVPTPIATAASWVVLNCACTQILGMYLTRDEATAAAVKFGRCSFAYQLDTELN